MRSTCQEYGEQACVLDEEEFHCCGPPGTPIVEAVWICEEECIYCP